MYILSDFGDLPSKRVYFKESKIKSSKFLNQKNSTSKSSNIFQIDFNFLFLCCFWLAILMLQVLGYNYSGIQYLVQD